MFVRTIIHSCVTLFFIHSFVRSFIRQFIPSFFRSFICSIVHSFIFFFDWLVKLIDPSINRSVDLSIDWLIDYFRCFLQKRCRLKKSIEEIQYASPGNSDMGVLSKIGVLPPFLTYGNAWGQLSSLNLVSVHWGAWTVGVHFHVASETTGRTFLVSELTHRRLVDMESLVNCVTAAIKPAWCVTLLTWTAITLALALMVTETGLRKAVVLNSNEPST